MCPPCKGIQISGGGRRDVAETDPHEVGGRRIRLISDDDQDTKVEVGGILETFGFAVIDRAQVFVPK